MSVVTRFAPSPTGFLHLGHAYSAWVGWARAREAGGRFLVRLEDIDGGRCKPEFAAAALEDLAWLGLDWDGAVRVQSAHLAEYRVALGRLDGLGLLYPCFCTRAEIAAAQAAPHGDVEKYPGTCRGLGAAERRALMGEKPYALRLDVAEAVQQAGKLRFFEEQKGWVEVDAARFGDGVLARKDTPTSYHLCVVHDDALQGVTHVTRGEDLADVTHVHVLLQRLLGLPTPVYAHHKLLTDGTGKRLAKRDKAATLRAMREAGVAPADVLLRLHGFAATHIADV
jgi:glutamyl-Q tRNA(Asp) synthetase